LIRRYWARSIARGRDRGAGGYGCWFWLGRGGDL